uniref:Uncharacterized protein n=1 Tax=Utricularia reniformis TaxID=192314 RepID=A0A1Y0B450_9LAMI|nr:hypothetical protein AEK19_MT1945 [Utricularia reniformis]ART32109.1 hypothetical protein AEK19_MT1945 [Utricularia reniformis]
MMKNKLLFVIRKAMPPLSLRRKSSDRVIHLFWILVTI